jgi:AraC-like DNA-binding protein
MLAEEELPSMEIVNKDSFNTRVRHKLKIQLNSWLPPSAFTLVLWPDFATRVTYADGYFVRHTHYEKWCACSVEKGFLQVISNGRAFKIKEGQTALIPPGPHTLSAEDGEVTVKVLGIGGHLLRLILETLAFNRCLVVENFLTEEYERIFDEVYTLLGKRDPANGSRLSLLAYSVLMYAVRFVPRQNLPKEVMQGRQFIQRNLFQKITLSDLCRETGCSRTRLCTLFKQYMTFSPGKYIANERHKYAMELLTSSPSLPVKQVASYCGYRSQLYFAKDFKKHTGMTPSGYREKYAAK